MSSATAEPSPLRIVFGPGQAAVFDAGLPVLAGEPVEKLFHTAQPAGRVGGLALFRMDEWLLGAATIPVTDGLEAAAHRVYQDISQSDPWAAPGADLELRSSHQRFRSRWLGKLPSFLLVVARSLLNNSMAVDSRHSCRPPPPWGVLRPP